MRKKTGKMVSCAYCGQLFYRPAWKARLGVKYCSHECYLAHHSETATVILICEQCSKPFTRLAGTVNKNSNQHFCSVACSAQARRKRTLKTCQFCGVQFEVRPCESHRKYCSRPCAYNHHVREIINCAQCGKEVESYPSRPRVYCSRTCFRKATIDFRKTERFVLSKIDAILGYRYSRLLEHTFDWLVNPGTGHNLYIDAFYPELNLAIEYNGLYHYKGNVLFDSRYSLAQRQALDALKAKLLAEHNVKLLTIKFDEPRTAQHYRRRLREINIPV